MEVPLKFLGEHIGQLEFRQKNKQPLSQIIFPISNSSFNHYYREFLKPVSFDDILKKELIFVMSEARRYLLSKEPLCTN